MAARRRRICCIRVLDLAFGIRCGALRSQTCRYVALQIMGLLVSCSNGLEGLVAGAWHMAPRGLVVDPGKVLIAIAIRGLGVADHEGLEPVSPVLLMLNKVVGVVGEAVSSGITGLAKPDARRGIDSSMSLNLEAHKKQIEIIRKLKPAESAL